MAAPSSMDAGARRGPHPLALAYLTFFILLIVAGAGITLFGNSHAGDSVVSIALPSPAAKATRAEKSAASAIQKSAATTQLTDQAQVPPTATQPVTKQVFSGRALIADPSLTENTPSGPLPRIADDGTTPMRAYAPPAVSDGHPRIAIVIGGLGISAKQTEAALKGLPSGVTLAVAPYAGDAQHWVTEARGQGHEVLLQIPMEPYDFPDSDPGPHTLRSGAGEDANTERLVWALTRFSGYAGVTNLLGGRFLSDANSLEPMLTYLARRGLMFYDNGQSPHSVAPDVAGRVGVPFAQADSEIDMIQTAMEIDHRLSALESIARSRGFAAGTGGLYPVTIDRVRNWAQGLSGRGFVLVPASAIVGQSK